MAIIPIKLKQVYSIIAIIIGDIVAPNEKAKCNICKYLDDSF